MGECYGLTAVLLFLSAALL